MQELRNLKDITTLGRVSPQVPALLRPFGDVSTPRQEAGSVDAGGNTESAGEPWTGASAGVRKPEDWETPLSADEIRLGLAQGEIK
jgi:hypothetical protein